MCITERITMDDVRFILTVISNELVAWPEGLTEVNTCSIFEALQNFVLTKPDAVTTTLNDASMRDAIWLFLAYLNRLGQVEEQGLDDNEDKIWIISEALFHLLWPFRDAMPDSIEDGVYSKSMETRVSVLALLCLHLKISPSIEYPKSASLKPSDKACRLLGLTSEPENNRDDALLHEGKKLILVYRFLFIAARGDRAAFNGGESSNKAVACIEFTRRTPYAWDFLRLHWPNDKLSFNLEDD
jgi:hypothetical protein